MKVHEYQAKELMKARGIAVPLGYPVTDVAGAVAAVKALVEATGNPVVVVKSQIHAGGRGKGRFKEHPELGGVTVVTDGIAGGVAAAEEKVRELAEKMLGSTLVTIQTGPEGKQVNRLYLEQGIDIDRELYLSVLLDRSTSRNILMASTEGGTEIEVVAAETPERDPEGGDRPRVRVARLPSHAPRLRPRAPRRCPAQRREVLHSSGRGGG